MIKFKNWKIKNVEISGKVAAWLASSYVYIQEYRDLQELNKPIF